jgi:uncharacterized protein Smg (DUF494 family)
MNDERERTALRRVLLLLSEHLEDFLEGDELALERLGAALEQGAFGGEDLQAAVLALRGLAGERSAPVGAVSSVEQAPGEWSQRVLSPIERESLSPEAWGYLLDLKRRGSLDSEQFERVLDRLAASGMRAVDVETAHEVAVRIAMPGFSDGSGGETSDVAH